MRLEKSGKICYSENYFNLNRIRDQERMDRFGQSQAQALLPEMTSPNASRLPTSPESQGSSQATSTPRVLTYDGWQARQMRDLGATDRSVSGLFSPIRGDLSIPAGTMYRPWDRSELEARYDNALASFGTTGGLQGSRSMMELTGPNCNDETGQPEPPGPRRAVTFIDNGVKVEAEEYDSGKEESPDE